MQQMQFYSHSFHPACVYFAHVWGRKKNNQTNEGKKPQPPPTNQLNPPPLQNNHKVQGSKMLNLQKHVLK